MRPGLHLMWSCVLAAVTVSVPRPVTACVPVFHVAHGFAVTDAERLGVKLPANARGIIFFGANGDGSVVPVTPANFVLTDRYRHRVPVEVRPVTNSLGESRFFVRPVGGFIAGDSYALAAAGVEPEPNSPYAAKVYISVEAPLEPEALERDARIITGRSTEVIFSGASAKYADRITRVLRSASIPPRTDCDFVFSQTIWAAPGCHVVKATLSFPEVDDRDVRLAALVCGGWLALSWRA